MKSRSTSPTQAGSASSRRSAFAPLSERMTVYRLDLHVLAMESPAIRHFDNREMWHQGVPVAARDLPRLKTLLFTFGMRTAASVMAFGSGSVISALSFDLVAGPIRVAGSIRPAQTSLRSLASTQ